MHILAVCPYGAYQNPQNKSFTELTVSYEKINLSPLHAIARSADSRAVN